MLKHKKVFLRRLVSSEASFFTVKNEVHKIYTQICPCFFFLCRLYDSFFGMCGLDTAISDTEKYGRNSGLL